MMTPTCQVTVSPDNEYVPANPPHPGEPVTRPLTRIIHAGSFFSDRPSASGGADPPRIFEILQRRFSTPVGGIELRTRRD